MSQTLASTQIYAFPAAEAGEIPFSEYGPISQDEVETLRETGEWPVTAREAIQSLEISSLLTHHLTDSRLSAAKLYLSLHPQATHAEVAQILQMSEDGETALIEWANQLADDAPDLDPRFAIQLNDLAIKLRERFGRNLRTYNDNGPFPFFENIPDAPTRRSLPNLGDFRGGHFIAADGSGLVTYKAIKTFLVWKFVTSGNVPTEADLQLFIDNGRIRNTYLQMMIGNLGVFGLEYYSALGDKFAVSLDQEYAASRKR